VSTAGFTSEQLLLEEEVLVLPPLDLVAAAEIGAIETMEQEKLALRAQHIGKVLNDGLKALAAKYSVIGEVRGMGTVQAIELVITDELLADALGVLDAAFATL
jgi:4-aminobutyrate aminotransferase-like enzyme